MQTERALGRGKTAVRLFWLVALAMAFLLTFVFGRMSVAWFAKSRPHQAIASGETGLNAARETRRSSPPERKLYRFQQSAGVPLYGFRTESGTVVIEPIFSFALEESSGGMVSGRLAANGMYGAYDLEGVLRIPHEYEYIGKFVDGLAPAARAGRAGRAGYIDVLGNTRIPFRYVQGWPFSDGPAKVGQFSSPFIVRLSETLQGRDTPFKFYWVNQFGEEFAYP